MNHDCVSCDSYLLKKKSGGDISLSEAYRFKKHQARGGFKKKYVPRRYTSKWISPTLIKEREHPSETIKRPFKVGKSFLVKGKVIRAKDMDELEEIYKNL